MLQLEIKCGNMLPLGEYPFTTLVVSKLSAVPLYS